MMDLFGAAYGWVGGRVKKASLYKVSYIPHNNEISTVILYLKQNHKNQNIRILRSAFFSPEINNFSFIKKYRYRLHFGA